MKIWRGGREREKHHEWRCRCSLSHVLVVHDAIFLTNQTFQSLWTGWSFVFSQHQHKCSSCCCWCCLFIPFALSLSPFSHYSGGTCCCLQSNQPTKQVQQLKLNHVTVNQLIPTIKRMFGLEMKKENTPKWHKQVQWQVTLNLVHSGLS